MIRRLFIFALFALLLPVVVATAEVSAEDWPQFKFDARHSGNVPDRDVTLPLGWSVRCP